MYRGAEALHDPRQGQLAGLADPVEQATDGGRGDADILSELDASHALALHQLPYRIAEIRHSMQNARRHGFASMLYVSRKDNSHSGTWITSNVHSPNAENLPTSAR